MCIMMLALLAILLRPFYLSDVREGVLLLTPSYDKKSVDSVVSKNPNLSVYHTKGTTPYNNSAPLDLYSDLEDAEKNLRVVAGQGLPSYILPRIKGKFDYLPSRWEEGVVELFVPNTIRKNSPTAISGAFYSAGKKLKLYLEGPSGKEDSLVIAAPGTTDFELSFTPRVEGRVLYKLIVMDSLNTQSREDIPLEVERFNPLNILIAQGYPTFEMQYLKNFLARQQHQIALRFQLSKQVFRTEYVNRSAVSLNRFNKKLLDEADLIILDQDALSGISVQERAEITSAIRDGLGLLVLMSDARSVPSDFLGAPMKKVSQDTATVIAAGKTIKFPVAAVRPVAADGLQTVLGNDGETLAGYRQALKGRIAFQLLQETYRLKLSGDSIAYGWIWSPLIDAVARSGSEGSQILVSNPFPVYVDEPITIGLMSSADRPAVSFDSTRLPLREDVLLDNLWGTTTWTDKPGWHSVQSTDGPVHSHYVFNDGDWSSLRNAQLIKANTKASRRQSIAPAAEAPGEKAYPPVYFFIAFVLAAGFLWLAPKL